jgi:hypothetical protein
MATRCYQITESLTKEKKQECQTLTIVLELSSEPYIIHITRGFISTVMWVLYN